MASTTSTQLPTLRHEIGATVTPGDRLGLATRNKTILIASKGTYLRQGHVYASLLGKLCVTKHQVNHNDNMEEDEDKWIISVQSEKSVSSSSSYMNNSSRSICPEVGMLIVGRVTRVMRPTQASIDIVAIVPEDDVKSNNNLQNNDNNTSTISNQIIPLHEPFSGILRQNEIRPNSSLEVRIEECIHPGDVILARIHANGEREYILTTAEAELGVIQAICESSGCVMQPISWKEMICPVSKVKEGRKVAKPKQMTRTV